MKPIAPLNLIVNAEAANQYLVENGLEVGGVPIVAALPQYEGTSSGQPALLLVIEIDGKKVLAKTTLRLMEAACRAMRAASGIDLDGNPVS